MLQVNYLFSKPRKTQASCGIDYDSDDPEEDEEESNNQEYEYEDEEFVLVFINVTSRTQCSMVCSGMQLYFLCYI